MALVFADRVKDSSTTTGTGTFTISGTAATGYQTFNSGIGVGNTCYYCIAGQAGSTDPTEWEVGLGTLASATTITRSSGNVLSSSSGAGTLVNFSAGAKDVFVTSPALWATSPAFTGNVSTAQLSVGTTDATTAYAYIAPTQSAVQYQFVVSGTNNYTGATVNGALINPNIVGTSSLTQGYGLTVNPGFTSVTGTVTGIIGTQSNPNWNSAGNMTNFSGVISNLALGASATGGTITNAYSNRAQAPTINASATTNITNFYQYYAAAVSNGTLQTITNAYAFYGNQASGSATNSWNLYMAGAAPNYLNGSLYLGGTTATSAILTGRSAANLTLGLADAAAPVAQTLSVQNVVAGTTNTAGANFTINGSRGTGTGAGGSIIFQTAAASTTGSTQNALVTQLSIAGNGGTTLTEIAGTSALTLTGATQTTSQPVLNMTQTWNAGAVTFTGVKLNVTNTASALASRFLDIQETGTSRVSVGIYSVGYPAIYLNGTQCLSIDSSNRATLGTASVSAQLCSSWTVNAGTGTLSSGNGAYQFALGGNAILTGKAAATLQHGAADAAAPVAQTVGVQSVVAGTSNTAGANFTINGSQGTGTGAGGSIIFQTAPASTTGSTQNALAAALTIAGTGVVTVGGFVATTLNVGSTVTTNAPVYFAGSTALQYNFMLQGTNTYAGNPIGMYINPNMAGNTTTTSIVGLQSTPIFGLNASATNATAIAIGGNCYINNTITPVQAYGIRGIVQLASPALSTTAITKAASFYASAPSIDAAATMPITSMSSFYAENIVKGGQATQTITNAYAYYGAQATGSATNSYNLYMAGNAPNYLAGTLNVIGATTLGTQGTTQGSLVLANTGTSVATTLKSSNSATAAYTITLPTSAGTSGQKLTTDGSGVTSWSTSVTNKILFTSSGTYTPTAGAIFVEVVVCGAGGGGGSGAYGSVLLPMGGAGGGGGAYIQGFFPVSELGASVTVTVGTGGPGGTSVAANGVGTDGTNGGQSSFGAFAIAGGGGGGGGGSSSIATASTAGSGAGGAIGNTGGSVGGVQATPGTGSISLTTLNGNTGNSGTVVTCLNEFCGTPGGGISSPGGVGPAISKIPGGTQFAYAPTGGGAGATPATSGANTAGQPGGLMAVTNAQAAGANTANAGNGTAATTFSPGGGGGGGAYRGGIKLAGNGIQGGGGGGGAANLSIASGAGGSGGNGFVYVVEYF